MIAWLVSGAIKWMFHLRRHLPAVDHDMEAALVAAVVVAFDVADVSDAAADVDDEADDVAAVAVDAGADVVGVRHATPYRNYNKLHIQHHH